VRRRTPNVHRSSPVKRALPVYPLLATIYFVLRLAADNGSELILAGDLVPPLAGRARCLSPALGLVGPRCGESVEAPRSLLALVCFSMSGVIASAQQGMLAPIGRQVGLLANTALTATAGAAIVPATARRATATLAAR
jgi:hypothetical protein